jgi:AraC-like DNA-binding protein
MQQLAVLRELMGRHARPGHPVTDLPGVRLVTALAPSPPISSIYEPAFALVAQGSKRTVLGDRVFEYGPGQYLVVSVDLPIVGQVTTATPDEPYLSLSMTLSRTAIASLILDMATDGDGSQEAVGFSVNDATPELLDSVIRLLRLLDHPEDVAVLRPMLEREILWRLLNGRQGATVRQIGLADSRLAQVARATGWIREHYKELLRIEEMADLAGMSLSSFHRHFRAVTAMSPLQYQKHIRLREARSRLLVDPGSVAAVGFAVGYQSPSQFSREYGRLFGAPPARDLARLRSGSPLDRGLA